MLAHLKIIRCFFTPGMERQFCAEVKTTKLPKWWCFVCWLPEEGFCADLSERGMGHKMGASPRFLNLKKHNYRELLINLNILTHFDGDPIFFYIHWGNSHLNQKTFLNFR